MSLNRQAGGPRSNVAAGRRQMLVSEIAAWEKRRNAAGERISWVFTVDRARQKLGRTFPSPSSNATKVAAWINRIH